MSIHLKDLFGLKNKQIVIQSASELLLVYELDKYLKSMLNERLHLEEVTILPKLLESNFFMFVMNNGVAFEYNTKIENYSKITPFLFLDTISEDSIYFLECTDKKVVYDFDSNPEINRIYHGANKDHAYISIVAYIYIKAFVNKKKFPEIILGNDSYSFMAKEYQHIIILTKHGNKFIKNLEWKGICNEPNLSVEWASYIMYRRQLGYMNRPYTLQEKFKYAIENYKVGDVLLYYKRNCKKNKYVDYISDDRIPNIISCYPAVIRELTDTYIKIDYYPLVETRLTRHIKLSCIDSEYIWADELNAQDYDLYTVAQENFHYVNVGIDDLTYDEEAMLLKLFKNDGQFLFVQDKDTKIHQLWFPTIEAVYAVFEDRQVKYNKKRFLDIYYDNNTKKPLYDLIIESDTDSLSPILEKYTERRDSDEDI